MCCKDELFLATKIHLFSCELLFSRAEFCFDENFEEDDLVLHLLKNSIMVFVWFKIHLITSCFLSVACSLLSYVFFTNLIFSYSALVPPVHVFYAILEVLKNGQVETETCRKTKFFHPIQSCVFFQILPLCYIWKWERIMKGEEEVSFKISPPSCLGFFLDSYFNFSLEKFRLQKKLFKIIFPPPSPAAVYIIICNF